MVIDGYPWLSMVIHGYPWLSMVIHGYPWLSMVIRGFLWLSLVIIGYPWLSLVINGYPWLSMVTDGYRWLSMVIHGYPEYVFSWFVSMYTLYCYYLLEPTKVQCIEVIGRGTYGIVHKFIWRECVIGHQPFTHCEGRSCSSTTIHSTCVCAMCLVARESRLPISCAFLLKQSLPGASTPNLSPIRLALRSLISQSPIGPQSYVLTCKYLALECKCLQVSKLAVKYFLLQ